MEISQPLRTLITIRGEKHFLGIGRQMGGITAPGKALPFTSSVLLWATEEVARADTNWLPWSSLQRLSLISMLEGTFVLSLDNCCL